MIDQEIALAQREGVRREENFPFLMEPEHLPSAGVLLVHGFTASPWEMRPLGAELAKAGFAALGVRLPGHGTTPEDLAGRRLEEWLAAVEGGFRLLSGRYSRVYGAGLSTGSLLLLNLAERLPLAGLVLLSPFLRLRHSLAPAAGLLRYFSPYQSRQLPQDLRPFYYDRRPTNGVFQICRLLHRLRPTLGRITLPALTLCSQGDTIVPVDSALDLFRQLGSRQRELHLFGPEVPHVLTTEENPRRETVLRMVITYLAGLEASSRQGD